MRYKKTQILRILLILGTALSLEAMERIEEIATSREISQAMQAISPEDKLWIEDQARALQKIKPIDPRVTVLSNEPYSTLTGEKAKALTANRSVIPGSELFVFISFSMSEQSLKAWAQQLTKTGGTLVLRGLIENSLKKTLAQVQQVFGADAINAIHIDPVAFKTFGISAVPAVVISQAIQNASSEPIKKPVFDVVYGDVGLSYALKKIAESGEKSDIAKTYLEILENKI